MAARISPALPTAFSSIDGLGAPVAYFRPGARARAVPLILAGVCALAAAVVLAYGLASSATAYIHYGWAVVQGLATTPAVLLAFFIIVGLAFLAYALVQWNWAAAVYEGGIAFRGPGGLRAWPWSEVTALYAAVTFVTGLFPRTEHRYTLEHSSGQRASFDDRLRDVTDLGALLGRRIVERYYPPAAARFNAGDPVGLGEVSLDQKGIRVKGLAMAWGQVEGVTVRRGFFEVRGKDGTHTGLPVAEIPNLDVLLLLLDHITDLRLEE
jgi:hypothetical protein